MFDIQLFGDNDTVTSSNTLYFNFQRADGTYTTKWSMKNPKDELTAASVRSALYALANTDSGSANFQFFMDTKTNTSIFIAASDPTAYKYGTAYTVEQTIRDLDLT